MKSPAAKTRKPKTTAKIEVSAMIANSRKKVTGGTRKNRTLSLHDRSYIALKNHCSLEGLTVSEVVDELIAAYVMVGGHK